MEPKAARGADDDGPNAFRLDSGPWVFSFFSEQPGRWVLARVHVEDASGVTPVLLRSAPIDMAWKVFTERMTNPAPDGWSVGLGEVAELAAPEQPRRPKPPKRRGKDVRQWADERLLDLAVEYVALCKIDPTPTASLAKREHLSADRLRALLARARDRDFLTRTEPGQSGGELTSKAIQMLAARPS